MQRPAWVAVDWGTSNLRLWGMDINNNVLFTQTSNRGMASLTQSEYAPVLAELLQNAEVDPKADVDIVICGMAGSKTGWKEAPYLETPVNLSTLGHSSVSPNSGPNGNAVYIMPGICQRDPEDIMRGEETQLLGLAMKRADRGSLVCLPGTHAKWARLDGLVVSNFSTAMTGELFWLFSTYSVLRHAMTDRAEGLEYETGLREGLETGLHEPHRLLSRVFRARSSSLLFGRSAQWSTGYLSGLLVGSDIAGYLDEIRGEPVQIIGAKRLSEVYAQGLRLAGAESELVDATQVTLKGLAAARRQILNG